MRFRDFVVEADPKPLKPLNTPEYDMLAQLVKEIGAPKLVMPIQAREEALEEALYICQRMGTDTEAIYSYVADLDNMLGPLNSAIESITHKYPKGADVGHWFHNRRAEKTFEDLERLRPDAKWTKDFMKGVRGALWTLHDILDSIEKGDYNPQSDTFARAAMKHLKVMK